MKKTKGIIALMLFVFLPVAFFGCGLSKDQLDQLDALQKEVASLQKDADALKDQKSDLEKQVAEKNKKLEDCNRQKQEVKANLDKMGK
jgi:septal ring factor EnvC (AmiA/AmiB activator)